jgi:hypothetical protein
MRASGKVYSAHAVLEIEELAWDAAWPNAGSEQQFRGSPFMDHARPEDSRRPALFAS